MLSREEFLNNLEQIKASFIELSERIEVLEKENSELKSKIKLLSKLENELKNKDSEINALKEKLKEAEKKKNEIEAQLKKISELYKELMRERTKKVDATELLTIYVALLEKVFYAKPHAKILWLLHGEKSKMHYKELAITTGFPPAEIRAALGELGRAKIIEYDVETGEAKLIKRLY